jgi:basic membrane lipoprotein Med (substrate-binding protein (PBP1-ABC) superfamily)
VLSPDYTTMGKEWAYCGTGAELHSCAGYAPGAGCKAALTALGTLCYESPALKAAALKKVKTIACTYDGGRAKSGLFQDVPGGVALAGTTLTVKLATDVGNVDEGIANFLRKKLK